MEENELTYKIRHAIFEVYNTLGLGLLESIYQEAMVYQMREVEMLKVDEQVDVPVIYKAHPLIKSKLKIDILVDKKIIVELKSVEELKKVHYKQFQTYLKLSNRHYGLLVNFNTDNIRESIHRVFNGYI